MSHFVEEIGETIQRRITVGIIRMLVTEHEEIAGDESSNDLIGWRVSNEKG